MNVRDGFQEFFGQSIATGLEDLAANIQAQAVTIERQGFAALERAEQASASWRHLDEFRSKVVGELDQLRTHVQIDSQMQARVEAMKSSLGQADSFFTTANQTANFADNIAAIGKSVGGVIAALELIAQIRSPEGKAFEVGGELSKIAGGIVGGAAATIVGLGLVPSILSALGIGFFRTYFLGKIRCSPHRLVARKIPLILGCIF